jgi:hypothetical protein
MQVIQILAMNKEIEHVVTLTAHLQPSLNPIKGGRLKELGRLE